MEGKRVFTRQILLELWHIKPVSSSPELLLPSSVQKPLSLWWWKLQGTKSWYFRKHIINAMTGIWNIPFFLFITKYLNIFCIVHQFCRDEGCPPQNINIIIFLLNNQDKIKTRKSRHLNQIVMYNCIWNLRRITMLYRYICASRISWSAFQLILKLFSYYTNCISWTCLTMCWRHCTSL